MRHEEAVLYDLEFTAWPGTLERIWSGKDEYREIIRIGAIRIDLDSLQEVEVLDVLVKPSINPVLSDYCIELTGITDVQIQAEGMGLQEALHAFVGFVGDRNAFCYGTDMVVILENLGLKNIQFNARTLLGDRPVVITKYNKTDCCLESNAVEVILYGPAHSYTVRMMPESVNVEINLHGNCVQLTNTNLTPWFHAVAPETQGKSSGEIAKTLGISDVKGDIHDPIFDVRSIIMGLRELVLCRHIANPLK